jgi:hypothetical protein
MHGRIGVAEETLTAKVRKRDRASSPSRRRMPEMSLSEWKAKQQQSGGKPADINRGDAAPNTRKENLRHE